MTPISSNRLETAQKAYASGDYNTARAEFEGLLADPGAAPEEARLALYWRGRSELAGGDHAAAVGSLSAFLQQYPTDQLARAAQFNLGRAYEGAGQAEEAVQAYLGSIVPDDPINVYIYERIGDARLATGAYTETIAAYQAGIDATEDNSFKVHLREGIAQVELLHNNPAGAIAQYEDILKMAQIEAYRAKILRLLGEAYMAAGNPQAAYEKYLEAVNLYPTAPDTHPVLVELVNANVPVDEFQRGLVNYHAAAYTPAIAAFERYLAALPAPTVAEGASEALTTTTTLTPTAEITGTAQAEAPEAGRAGEALWLLGLSQKYLGQYSNAVATFRRLIETYPRSEHWGEAHLEIGKTLTDQDAHAEAKAFLRGFAAQQPAHPLARDALWWAARLDMSDQMYEEAHTYMHQLINDYPQSQYTGEALYWAGQSAYALEDYQGAVNDWKELATKYPKSDLVNFGDYWRVRALLELKREEEAQNLLQELAGKPEDYYTLRARDLLAGQQPHAIPMALPSEAQLTAEQAEAEAWLRQWLQLPETTAMAALQAAVRDDPAFKRGATLLELGLRDQALVEFEVVKDNWWHDPLSMYQLALYFKENNLGRLGILTAARLIFLSPVEAPEEAPLFIQRLYYPIYFGEVIFAEAEALEVDPAMLLAIMRQESLFEFSALSIAGARGLMQVMPATGEYVAQHSGFEGFNPDHLWLPYVSIKFGSWYINQQLGLFDNNQFAALAAYNAGPGNVIEWLKISDDLDVFVEAIPFWESRTYIRRIYVNLAAYRRLYAASPDAQE
jgi:soluble lytic murein transglycosylase